MNYRGWSEHHYWQVDDGYLKGMAGSCLIVAKSLKDKAEEQEGEEKQTTLNLYYFMLGASCFGYQAPKIKEEESEAGGIIAAQAFEYIAGIERTDFDEIGVANGTD